MVDSILFCATGSGTMSDGMDAFDTAWDFLKGKKFLGPKRKGTMTAAKKRYLFGKNPKIYETGSKEHRFNSLNLSRIFHGKGPLSGYHIRPHFREAAGTILRDERNGKVLFIRRSSNETSKHGMWELPGGKVEGDEHPESTAYHETKEETGFPTQYLRHHGSHIDHEKSKVYHGYETTLHRDIDPNSVKLSDEHDDFRWVHPRDVQYLRDEDGGLSHHAEQLFRQHMPWIGAKRRMKDGTWKFNKRRMEDEPPGLNRYNYVHGSAMPSTANGMQHMESWGDWGDWQNFLDPDHPTQAEIDEALRDEHPDDPSWDMLR
jgi:8-oxo-dGTP pyrophosphatase MutT (NUDIX family)